MKKKALLLCVLGLALALPAAANVSSTGMPWETTLEKIQASITGPVARIVSVILVAAGGLTLAMGGGQAVKPFAWTAIGVGLAVNAANLMMPMFGVSGALL